MTMSRRPSPSKSSIAAPPALRMEWIPFARDTSNMRGSSRSEAKVAAGKRHFAGTPSGHVPSVMCARLRSHMVATSSGESSSASVK
jgi:hypothetical protein